jgi:hypothetical protein
MNQKPNPALKTFLLLLLLVGVGGVFTLIAIQMTAGEPLFDFTAFWIAGKLTLSGGDPYLRSDWGPLYEPFNLGLADNQTFLYPKPILPIFLPFGLFPLRTAAILWLVLTQAAVLSSILMITRLWPDRRPSYLLPFLFGVFIFRSYLVTLTLGQLGGVFLLILAGVALLWNQSGWFWGGVLLSLTTLKPQLGFPLVALASLWFLKKRIWLHFSGMAAGGALMLVTGWLIDPQWIGKFIEIGSNKVSQTFGYHPTLWGLGGYLCDRQAACTYFVGGLLAILFSALFLWVIFQRKFVITPDLLLSASITFTLLITPYLWVYDQLLLIVPLAVLLGKMRQQGNPYLITAIVSILIGLVSLALLPVAVSIRNDVWNVVIPLLVLALFFFSILKTVTIEPSSNGEENP